MLSMYLLLALCLLLFSCVIALDYFLFLMNLPKIIIPLSLWPSFHFYMFNIMRLRHMVLVIIYVNISHLFSFYSLYMWWENWQQYSQSRSAYLVIFLAVPLFLKYTFQH